MGDGNCFYRAISLRLFGTQVYLTVLGVQFVVQIVNIQICETNYSVFVQVLHLHMRLYVVRIESSISEPSPEPEPEPEP